MSGRISRIFINDLLARTNIVDLINSRIKLKKQGKHYKTYCPFHNENTPSFTVNKDKQFYYCFGCGATGNAIDFLINYERYNFIESIQELANINGIDLPHKYQLWNKLNPNKYHKCHSLYKLLNNLNCFYSNNLYKPEATLVRQYLITTRGLDQEIIHRFSIGYAGCGWNNVIKSFTWKPNELELLIAAGIVIRKDNNKIYERFRNRIMFPIRNKRGYISGFGGRCVIRNNMPKYLNSPETIIFQKSQHLYGLYEAHKNNSQLTKLLIVEGYMDVITLAQFGIDYAVAVLGTATTTEHIKLLFCSTDNIICCYDGDIAGNEAAWRTLKVALPYMQDDRKLQFMLLPNGEDPDSLIRKEGKEKFENRIIQAMSLPAFMFTTLSKHVDLSSIEGKIKLANLSLPLILQIPGKTLRIYLRQTLGIKLGILDDHLLDKLITKNLKNEEKLAFPSIKKTTMRLLITLLMKNPKFASNIFTTKTLEESKIAGIKLFIELVNYCKKYPNITVGQILELYRGTNFSSTLETLATWNHMIVDEEAEKVFQDSLSNIYNSLINAKLDILIARDRTVSLNAAERREFWILHQSLAKK